MNNAGPTNADFVHIEEHKELQKQANYFEQSHLTSLKENTKLHEKIAKLEKVVEAVEGYVSGVKDTASNYSSGMFILRKALAELGEK